MVDPSNPVNIFKSALISTNASAATFKNAISSFYSTYFSASISVTREMYDATGTETTNVMLSVQNKYTISLLKSITGYSCNDISIQAGTSASDFGVRLPSAVQSSGAPMTGKFVIKCPLDRNGTLWNTTDPID